jgi:hypothetical protein
VTVWLTGCVLMEGASGTGLTDNAAGPLVTVPAELLIITVNFAPLSDMAVAGEV